MKNATDSVETLVDEKSVFDVKDIKKNNRIKQRILFAVIAVVCAAGVAAVLIRTLCKVGEIGISPTELYDPQDIVEVTGIKIGDNLFSFSSAAAEKNIAQNFPYLDKISVRRVLPSGVSISFEHNMGTMAIRLGDDYYAIDDDQTVLKKCEAPDDGGVHRITVISDRISRCVVGEKMVYNDDNLFSMVDDICRAVDANGVLDKISFIDLTDTFDVTMDYDSRFEIKLGNTENMNYKIAMIVKVVAQLYPDDTGQIDVRETSTAYVKRYT
ncbi:MAG: FtsQ-type POTRA domain-containing protein [Clostridia bacterium]|nr:FtsQ-type POTRA domain-containing protein [Clostridia bacterium]